MSEYSPKINQTKSDAVVSLKESFSGATGYFFADYRGMTVAQMSELRAQLRKNNASVRVVKNNYAKIALNQLDKPKELGSYLVGPTAVTVVKGENGPVAKLLVDLAKEMPLEVKGGLVDDMIFDAQQVLAFSRLPTKLELIQTFVCMLNAIPSKLARTLLAVQEQKEGKE